MANFEKIEERPTWNNMSTPKVMERMYALYESNKWHDCVFKLWKMDGSEDLVFAHNLVLASSSPVFEALCFGPMHEDNPIEIPDIEPSAFKMMLKFIYTDNIDFTSVELACNVLYASKKYLIYTLVGLAVSFISHHINESNCLQVYDFARFVQEEKLIKESWNFFCSHLDEVLKYISHESLTIDLVKNLVNEEALNCSEVVVFKICTMWAEMECHKNNLEASGENLRKMFIKADIFNKIRWLTFSEKEFEECSALSDILTGNEVNFILKAYNLINNNINNFEESETENKFIHLKFESKVPKLCNEKISDQEVLLEILSKNNVFPFNLTNIIPVRKKIQLKKFYCHRFIEQETKPLLSLKNDLKIITFITANKSVRLTAIFLNAKILPLSQLNSGYTLSCSNIERDYKEKLNINIYDDSDRTLFSVFFCEYIKYGTIFKILLQTPVILERSKEYKIQIELLNSIENYLFGIRNSFSKFPSGLCVTFKEYANIGKNKNVVEAIDLSVISGLELCI